MQNADVSYRAGSRCRLLSRTWWTCKFRSMYLIRRGIHDKFSGWKIKQLSTYSKKSVHIMKFCFRLLSESTGGYCSEEIKFGAIFRIPTYPLIFQLKLSEDRYSYQYINSRANGFTFSGSLISVTVVTREIQRKKITMFTCWA